MAFPFELLGCCFLGSSANLFLKGPSMSSNFPSPGASPVVTVELLLIYEGQDVLRHDLNGQRWSWFVLAWVGSKGTISLFRRSHKDCYFPSPHSSLEATYCMHTSKLFMCTTLKPSFIQAHRKFPPPPLN